ncbi:MAG: hypothetical protein ABSG68_20415 [Thermoguttaceae bacterium]|jgi:hypothetical protein
MWEWCDKLKLGKSSAFTKRDIRSLPQTEAEFEADFFLDPEFSTESQEAWNGVVIEREYGAVLALEEVRLPPPTVNNLADLLAHTMLRPLNDGKRLRPGTVYLRDRPQWQELLPHLEQLGIKVVLGQDLPWFDEAAVEWIQYKTEQPPSADKVKAILRKPFPERERTWFTDAMELMEWSDAMFKGAYPRRNAPDPTYEPTTVVSTRLATDELEAILTKTNIARTKKRRPRLEAMAVENKTIDLEVTEWSSVLLSLCGPKVDGDSAHRRLLGIARRIANQLAEALEIDGPPSPVK